MLRFVAPILTKTIGKTVYDDIRRMETTVGAFTARVDLADYLVSLAADSAKSRRTVIVSTTQSTPSLWQMLRREAGSGDGAGPVSPKTDIA
jgi:hypothetical protein